MNKRQPNALQKMGLNSPAALALHLPVRYEDETQLWTISDALKQGRFQTVQTQGLNSVSNRISP